MFELRPDLFPAGYLTADELDLWDLHYQEREAASGRSAKNR